MPVLRLPVDTLVDNEVPRIDDLFVVESGRPAEGCRDRNSLIQPPGNLLDIFVAQADRRGPMFDGDDLARSPGPRILYRLRGGFSNGLIAWPVRQQRFLANAVLLQPGYQEVWVKAFGSVQTVGLVRGPHDELFGKVHLLAASCQLVLDHADHRKDLAGSPLAL